MPLGPFKVNLDNYKVADFILYVKTALSSSLSEIGMQEYLDEYNKTIEARKEEKLKSEALENERKLKRVEEEN